MTSPPDRQIGEVARGGQPEACESGAVAYLHCIRDGPGAMVVEVGRTRHAVPLPGAGGAEMPIETILPKIVPYLLSGSR